LDDFGLISNIDSFIQLSLLRVKNKLKDLNAPCGSILEVVEMIGSD
jgi:hypothetical protein